MHLFRAYLEIYTLTKTPRGSRFRFEHRQLSRSFLQQWIQALRANFQYSGEPNVRDTTNNLRTHNQMVMRMNATAGQTGIGIVIGTGNTPLAITDYKIETLIPHGTGPGQLSYKAMVFDPFQVVGSVASFRMKRQFENLSGNTITVKEAAAYHIDNTNYVFCTLRDVLTTPFDIGNGQIAEFRYTIKATV